jgi:UDP-glucose 4-epimerase
VDPALPTGAPRGPIAVTGASGWIGRRLREVAQSRGEACRALQRADLEAGRLEAALAGCRAVVHLAGLAHASAGEAEHRDANCALAGRVAAAAARAGVRRMVFVSTAKVMGERSARPLSEADPPAPADAYGRAKLDAERALLAAHAPPRFEVVVLRPPLVYGPGVRANFLALLRAARSPWPLPLADARAPRSMVYVDNLVDALLFACDAPQASGRVFFVADDADACVAGLLRGLRGHWGRPARLFALPAAAWRALRAAGAALGRDPGPALDRLTQPLQVDASALRSIGWRAPVAPGEALAATADWFAAARDGAPHAPRSGVVR